jgi:hypothetical protein
MSDLDLNDILLEATAEVQEIVRELMQELAEPHMRAQIRQAWMSAPDEMKDQFAKERPEEYRALMNALEERQV